jgi:hypothetical protein
MGQIAFMPVLVLAARLCPSGVEATLFAVLMSVSNIAGMVSYEFGAVLMHWMNITETNFENLWLLVLVTNLSTLLPLPFLNWLPASSASGDGDDGGDALPQSTNPPVPQMDAGLEEVEGIRV